jgi:hypothetical protein
MEGLRIATPPRAARARKKHELPAEKNPKGPIAAFFAHAFGVFFPQKDKVKEEAQLNGLGDEEGSEDEGSQAGSAVAQQEQGQGPVPPRPSLLARLKNRARKYTEQDGDDKAWDGNGVPPWVERGSSVAWSEDKSRKASEYGDNLVDFLANPRRILSEPPTIFDPVEDRVRSRWLAVFALCAVPSILATIMLLDVWDKSTIFKLDERPVITTLFRSGDPMLLNMQPAQNMSIKVCACASFFCVCRGGEQLPYVHGSGKRMRALACCMHACFPPVLDRKIVFGFCAAAFCTPHLPGRGSSPLRAPHSRANAQVQALNRHGWPMKSLEITAHVVDWHLAPSAVRDLPFCSRTLEAADDSMGNAQVCRYNLVGVSAKTDRDGVATFSELLFDSGLPGGYRLEFFAPRSLFNATEWFSVKPSVTQVIVDEHI